MILKPTDEVIIKKEFTATYTGLHYRLRRTELLILANGIFLALKSCGHLCTNIGFNKCCTCLSSDNPCLTCNERKP